MARRLKNGPLTAIILAGGASRRLGQDKATLRLGDRALLEIVVDRVGAVSDEVIVACGRKASTPRLREAVRMVPDAMPGAGPLAGLQAGLRRASNPFALVVACDMPFLNADVIGCMAGLPRRYQALVPRIEGRLQPLHAIYSRACLGTVEALLAQGGDSMDDLLARLEVDIVPEETLRRYDPAGLSAFNLNGPGDLKQARRLWREATVGSASGPEAA